MKKYFSRINSSSDIENMLNSINRIIILNMNENNICSLMDKELVVSYSNFY